MTSTMTSWPIYGLAVFAIAIVAIALPVARFILATRRPAKFPPGPQGLLGLGNLHQIPLDIPFVHFHDWSRTWGPVIGLKAGPTNLVLLNSADAVHELFGRRGTIYSGRPYTYIPQEHVYPGHADKHLLSAQNGPFLRWFRSSVSPVVNAKVPVDGCLDIQDATSSRLIHGLLQRDKTASQSYHDLVKHTRRWALEGPLLVIVGERTDDQPDSFVQAWYDAGQLWVDLLEPTQTPPVDIIPFLRVVPEPMAAWKKKARTVREYNDATHIRYLAAARQLAGRPKDKNNRAFRSILTRLMDKNEQAKDKAINDDSLRFLASNTIDAAVTTTWAAFMGLILHMAAFPEIQAKARDEIDRVCGDVLPGPNTIHELPYLQACLLEILRSRPPAPLAVPHMVDQEDSYLGYTIPKGATIMANLYALGHDPDAYQDPDTFDPDRYIRHPHGLRDGADLSEAIRRTTHAFGTGRRMCPGEQFARNSLLLATSKLLWAFEIVPAEGETLDVSLERGYAASFDLKPKPFNVDLKLRAEEKRVAIASGLESASTAINSMFDE